MSGKFAQIKVLVPVTQAVKVEGVAAAGNFSSRESAASFLLSKWVLATHRAAGRKSASSGLAVNRTGAPS